MSQSSSLNANLNGKLGWWGFQSQQQNRAKKKKNLFDLTLAVLMQHDLDRIVGPFYSLVWEHFRRIYIYFGWYIVQLENTMMNVSSTAHIGPHWSFRILIQLNHSTRNCRLLSAPLHITSDLLPYPDLIPSIDHIDWTSRLTKHYYLLESDSDCQVRSRVKV